MDTRIGRDGAYEPLVCAITGQLLSGRHAVTFALVDGYFYRVLSKAVSQHSQALHDELLALVTPKPTETKKKKTE